MANTQRTIPEILQVAKVSQYLAANDVATKTFMKGGALDMSISRMIYIERKSVQNLYDLDPTNSTLRDTANYLWAILGKYAIQAENILANLDQAPPVVTGADNESVADGQQVTFSIGVTSDLPYTIQWYSQSGLVPGATSADYTFTATLADDGNTYYAVVSNAAGSVQSATGALSVTQTIQGFAWYGDTDPYPALSGGTDALSYQVTFPITDGQPFEITYPLGAANNQYEVIKVPIGQSVKTIWYSSALNNGNVPDAIFRANITIGSFRYYISRVAMSIDTTNSPNMVLS